MSNIILERAFCFKDQEALSSMYNIARGLHSGRFKENVLKALDDAININTLQCNYAHQMAENIDDYLESEIEELINEINRKHGNTCE